MKPLHITRDLRAVRGLYFLYYAGYAIFTVFINVYYRQIGLSGVQIGWINTLAPLIGILAGPLWGLASDRSGRPHLIMALAVLGSVLSMLGLSVMRAFVWLLPLAGAWYLFNATLFPMIDTATLATLGGQTENYGRQRIFGSIGYFIVSMGGGLILERVGLERMFLGYTLIMLIMLAAVPSLPAARGQNMSGGLRNNLRELVRQPAWLTFSLSLIPLWMAINGMYTFLPVFLKDMHAGAGLIGAHSALTSLAELPFMLFSAVLVRKLGLKRMLGTAFGFFALRMLLYSLIPAPVWSLPVALLHGPTFGLFWVAAVIYINQLAPERMKTTAQTVYVSTISLAGVISAPLSGWAYDYLGGAVLFRIYAGLCLLALLLLVSGWRRAKK